MSLKRKIRKQISGTANCPRLSVFRSNKFMYAQLIDDKKGTTLASATDMKITKGTKVERTQNIGTEIAKKAIEKGISKVVFDRNGFRYAGHVKILADSAREAGLKF